MYFPVLNVGSSTEASDGDARRCGSHDAWKQREFIKRRGFWFLALLWLPAGGVATAVVRFVPATGAETGPSGAPTSVAEGLPPSRLDGGGWARRRDGGGVARGGIARPVGHRGVCGAAQPAGVDCRVVARAAGLKAADVGRNRQRGKRS
jgi:hypothetical protein